jgi:protein O-GlcNAc transferase
MLALTAKISVLTVIVLAIILSDSVASSLNSAPSFRTSEGKMHFEKAMKFTEKSLWKAAILEFNRALYYEPRNPVILIQLGITLGELAQWNQAITVLRKAVELAPDSTRAHYNLAVTLDHANPGTGSANAEYRKVLKLDPQHVDSLINLATNIGDQNRQEARKLIEEALQLAPKSPEAHLNLALLLRKDGELKGAMEALQKAIRLDPEALEPRRQLLSVYVTLERWNEAIDQCREIMRRNPKDWNTRYTFGQTLIRTGNIEEGRKELEKAQEIRRLQQKQEQAEKMITQGITNFTDGNVAEALKQFKSAMELNASPLAHMYLGMALAASGSPEEGIEELNKSIESDPSNAKAHHNLATVLLQQGQESKARGEFERALELDPYFPETHNNLGLILSKSHQTEEACEHFRLASELDPQYLEPLFNLGLALRSMNRIDEALQVFRHASEVAPDNSQVYFALGMTLKDKGDSQGAREALERAASLQQQTNKSKTN